MQILPEKIDRIVFIVCIYKGLERKQHFGMIENAFIRAVDAKGVEIARFDLSGQETANKCTVTFAEVYRKNEDWKFRAIGETHETDLFIKLLKQYL